MRRELVAALALALLAGAAAADSAMQPVALGADGRGLYLDPATGDLWAGRLAGFRLTPDFRLRNAPDNTVSTKLWVRSVYVGDIGDPSDIALRRAGPDNSDRYTAVPAPVPSGTWVGALYWQACGAGGMTDNEGHEDCFEPVLGRGRLAQIGARSVGEMTATSRAGNLYLATTPYGAIDPIDRLVIAHDGELFVWLPWKQRLGKVRFGGADSCGTGRRCLYVDN